MKAVLDTSALSALMLREGPALARARARAPDDWLLSAPVCSEIRFGLERLVVGSQRRLLLEAEYRRWRAAVGWRDWDEAAAERAGRLRAQLERAGTPIGDFDAVIASIALEVGAAVATANVRHFRLVPGLAVEEWTSDATI